MKDIKDLGLLFSICIALTFAAVGCEEEKDSSDTQTLVVERRYVRLNGNRSFDRTEFVIDVPIRGPQPLFDSIKVFLNETLCHRFEMERKTKLFTSPKVYSDDMPNIFASYADKYRQYREQYVDGFVTINIFLIAQTESFVTYGFECSHGSGSTGAEFYCYTFSKKDGHRINNLISWDNILRFIKDHPTVKHPFRSWQINSNSNSMSTSTYYDTGLLGDSLLMVNEDETNHYAVKKIAYEDVLPYLSDEAQSLVKDKGETSKWTECFMGERLATIDTRSKQIITLTVRPAKHDWAELYEDEAWKDETWSEGYSLTNNQNYDQYEILAFYMGNGEFTPANVLNGDSVIRRGWDELYSTNPSKDVFPFDSTCNKLYIPSVENVTMGYHECNDRYDVYQYNKSDKFVYIGEDGGFWLHPSIRQFGRLICCMKTKDYLIRIDEMRIYDLRYENQYENSKKDTHRYRYTAWKNKDNMLEKPDLVINDGYEDNNGFVFLNKGYKYVILRENKDRWLLVYQGEKLIFKQSLQDFDFVPTRSSN